MKYYRLLTAAGVLLAAVGAHAQVSSDSNCILAGRVSDNAQWAPRMAGVELLGQDGRAVTSASKQALAGVKQVRLSSPALLSRCDGNAELALGPDTPGPKGRVPAIGPGLANVESVSFPKLRRGGELVELKLTVPAERVTLVTR